MLASTAPAREREILETSVSLEGGPGLVAPGAGATLKFSGWSDAGEHVASPSPARVGGDSGGGPGLSVQTSI